MKIQLFIILIGRNYLNFQKKQKIMGNHQKLFCEQTKLMTTGDFTINDYDTDVVFPARVIYENLKNYYTNKNK